jgi:hypothetical protein
MMGGAKKALKVDFKKKQKTFAAAKRDLRTKKRAAKLDGKSCVWTRNPTPPPTEPPTPGPTGPPTPGPTGPPTPGPTGPPTPGPTGPPTPPPTKPPTPGPTGPPTPGPTGPPTPSPTIKELTHAGDFEIRENDNCTAKIKQLQTFHYIKGNLYMGNFNCTTSLELNLLKGIGGYMSFFGSLRTFNANQLQYVGGGLTVMNTDKLSTFNANKLQSLGGRLKVEGNIELGTLGLSSLNEINKNDAQNVYDLLMYNNKIDLCSEALQNVCTSSTYCTSQGCFYD